MLDPATAKALKVSGYSVRDIATAYGLSVGKVHRMLSSGWPARTDDPPLIPAKRMTPAVLASEVATLQRRGYSVARIASTLGVSVSTVRRYG